MKIKYLGTGAAEGIPAVFCECETCRQAFIKGGKNIRTRSQAIIDGELLIDFPADTYFHSLIHGIPLAKIKYCLITHSHFDHLYPNDIYYRKSGIFTHLNKENITFYAAQSGHDLIKDVITKNSIPENDVALKLVKPYQPFTFGNYKVFPIKANHPAATSPVVYLIYNNRKSIFYCHDTGELDNEALCYLQKLNLKIDLISLDCTEGVKKSEYSGHLDIFRCIKFVEKLKCIGIIDEKTKITLNHFSHNGGRVLYDDFIKIVDKYGFLVSYDGLEIEV